MPSIEIVGLPEYFRLEPRGWSFAPFTDGERIGQIDIDWISFHTVSMEPGTIRGNHVHPQVNEWLLFCGSPVLLVWQEADSEQPRQTRIDNNHTMIFIPGGVKHAIKNLGKDPLYLVAFRSPARDPEVPEVLPAVILKSC
jgi:dTDP-4-dehydrorhamnose 3,5-epimerase-like enzyme